MIVRLCYEQGMTLPGFFDDARDGLALDDYDYPLPEALIARYPLEERQASRMLVLHRDSGRIEHRRFIDFPDYMEAGDVLALNNTKVLPVRFYGNRQGFTGRVEILLLHPGHGAYQPKADETHALVWQALMRPAKKLKPGTAVEFEGTRATMTVLHGGERGCCTVAIDPAEHADMPTLMEKVGKMPIPPYLRRDAEESDKTRYQTVFSKIPGAQAAPTAGLHFTPEILGVLAEKGVQQAEVTLSVSAGTFRTVEEACILNHRMDAEWYDCPEAAAHTIRQAKSRQGRVFAVGTTVAKTLETVAAKYHGQLKADSDWSRLFITPGFYFQTTDCLLTNFHLPKSTLLMLISAFAGRHLVARAYEAALAEQYRFFSYGDCMLIL